MPYRHPAATLSPALQPLCAPPWRRAARVFGLCVLSACASAPRAPRPSAPPQQVLESRLIGRHNDRENRRTADGGMLDFAEFDHAHLRALRDPFDVLRAHCKRQVGDFQPVHGPARSAQALGASAPPAVRAALADADAQGIFGTFRCDSAGPSWTARVEPVALLPGRSSDSYRLKLYLKARRGGEPAAAPSMPGLPPRDASEQPPTAPPAEPPTRAAAPAPTAQAPPPLPPPHSPLDPRPPGPIPTADQMIADPQPFGVHLGSDTPAALATTLHLGAPSDCKLEGVALEPVAASGTHLQCWMPAGATQALQVRARFADLGAGPVLATLDVVFKPEAFQWLQQDMQRAWGLPDVKGDRPTAHRWSWGYSEVRLYRVHDDPARQAVVHAEHVPTLARARTKSAAATAPTTAATTVASPWQLRLGYEAALSAQAKLAAGGFSIAPGGCVDGGPYAEPVLIRTCSLRGPMDGLRSANVNIVDLGDGQPRLAALEYTFDKRVLASTLKQLRDKYGAPIAGRGSQATFWTGSVGVEVDPASDGFKLRYFHGRLQQQFDNASARNLAGAKARQRQGL